MPRRIELAYYKFFRWYNRCQTVIRRFYLFNKIKEKGMVLYDIPFPVHVLARKSLTKAEAFSQATGARLRQWYADALESLGPDASTEQPEDLAISHALPGV